MEKFFSLIGARPGKSKLDPHCEEIEALLR